MLISHFPCKQHLGHPPAVHVADALQSSCCVLRCQMHSLGWLKLCLKAWPSLSSYCSCMLDWLCQLYALISRKWIHTVWSSLGHLITENGISPSALNPCCLQVILHQRRRGRIYWPIWYAGNCTGFLFWGTCCLRCNFMIANSSHIVNVDVSLWTVNTQTNHALLSRIHGSYIEFVGRSPWHLIEFFCQFNEHPLATRKFLFIRGSFCKQFRCERTPTVETQHSPSRACFSSF